MQPVNEFYIDFDAEDPPSRLDEPQNPSSTRADKDEQKKKHESLLRGMELLRRRIAERESKAFKPNTSQPTSELSLQDNKDTRSLGHPDTNSNANQGGGTLHVFVDNRNTNSLKRTRDEGEIEEGEIGEVLPPYNDQPPRATAFVEGHQGVQPSSKRSRTSHADAASLSLPLPHHKPQGSSLGTPNEGLREQLLHKIQQLAEMIIGHVNAVVTVGHALGELEEKTGEIQSTADKYLKDVHKDIENNTFNAEQCSIEIDAILGRFKESQAHFMASIENCGILKIGRSPTEKEGNKDERPQLERPLPPPSRPPSPLPPPSQPPSPAFTPHSAVGRHAVNANMATNMTTNAQNNQQRKERQNDQRHITASPKEELSKLPQPRKKVSVSEIETKLREVLQQRSNDRKLPVLVDDVKKLGGVLFFDKTVKEVWGGTFLEFCKSVVKRWGYVLIQTMGKNNCRLWNITKETKSMKKAKKKEMMQPKIDGKPGLTRHVDIAGNAVKTQAQQQGVQQQHGVQQVQQQHGVQQQQPRKLFYRVVPIDASRVIIQQAPVANDHHSSQGDKNDGARDDVGIGVVDNARLPAETTTTTTRVSEDKIPTYKSIDDASILASRVMAKSDAVRARVARSRRKFSNALLCSAPFQSITNPKGPGVDISDIIGLHLNLGGLTLRAVGACAMALRTTGSIPPLPSPDDNEDDGDDMEYAISVIYNAFRAAQARQPQGNAEKFAATVDVMKRGIEKKRKKHGGGGPRPHDEDHVVSPWLHFLWAIYLNLCLNICQEGFASEDPARDMKVFINTVFKEAPSYHAVLAGASAAPTIESAIQIYESGALIMAKMSNDSYSESKKGYAKRMRAAAVLDLLLRLLQCLCDASPEREDRDMDSPLHAWIANFLGIERRRRSRHRPTLTHHEIGTLLAVLREHRDELCMFWSTVAFVSTFRRLPNPVCHCLGYTQQLLPLSWAGEGHEAIQQHTLDLAMAALERGIEDLDIKATMFQRYYNYNDFPPDNPTDNSLYRTPALCFVETCRRLMTQHSIHLNFPKTETFHSTTASLVRHPKIRMEPRVTCAADTALYQPLLIPEPREGEEEKFVAITLEFSRQLCGERGTFMSSNPISYPPIDMRNPSDFSTKSSTGSFFTLDRRTRPPNYLQVAALVRLVSFLPYDSLLELYEIIAGAGSCLIDTPAASEICIAIVKRVTTITQAMPGYSDKKWNELITRVPELSWALPCAAGALESSSPHASSALWTACLKLTAPISLAAMMELGDFAITTYWANEVLKDVVNDLLENKRGDRK